MLTIGTVLIYMYKKYASNNHPRNQVEISTDHQSIFYRVCGFGDWEIYRIPEYADDAIRIVMVNKRRCNDFICASLSLLIILPSEYYYVPIRKIKLTSWNLDLKWRSRFSYKVAGNAVLRGHSTVGL